MTQPLFFEIPNKPKSLLWNVIVLSPQYGEKTAFSFNFSVFPLADSPAEVFYQLSLWSFKKCSIKHFLMMQPKKWSALAIFFQRKKTCIIAVLCKIPTLSYDRAL